MINSATISPVIFFPPDLLAYGLTPKRDDDEQVTCGRAVLASGVDEEERQGGRGAQMGRGGGEKAAG